MLKIQTRNGAFLAFTGLSALGQCVAMWLLA